MTKWWSEQDEAFLVENFSYENLDACAEYLNRTEKAIISKAFTLGLLNKMNVYTEDEKDFLRLHYPAEGVKFCADRLNRTEDAIRRYAKILGIQRPQQGTPLYCPELNKYFDSINDASIKLGISNGNICSVLKGRLKNTKGYTFVQVQKEDYYNEKRKNSD